MKIRKWNILGKGIGNAAVSGGNKCGTCEWWEISQRGGKDPDHPRASRSHTEFGSIPLHTGDHWKVLSR